tara:strand:+ start:517 stop:708 length:192 start_codon:yes stop_codon:yes gene_type:complete
MDVSALNDKIRKLKKEIKKIQNNCSHKEQELKFTKGYTIRWVCKYCQLPLRWPSDKEKENWLK